MSPKRYSRKECRDRGDLALAMCILAVALPVATWFFSRRELAKGHRVHVSLYLMMAEAFLPLLALWLALDWAHYRRRLINPREREHK